MQRARALFASSADARQLGLGRIAFGALALLYAWQYSDFVDLIWFESPWRDTARLAAVIWPWAALPLLLGLGGRFAGLLHYLFVVALIEFPSTVRTPEQIFFGTISFAFVWLQASTALSLDAWIARRRDRSNLLPSRVPGWPLVLLGLALGIQMGTAGIAKCVDPLWIHGQALFYVVAQPWIRGPEWSFLLEWPGALQILSWNALLFELTLLPLFVVARTRPIAIVNLGVFGLAFFYPFTGMGLIGVFALASAFLLSALLPVERWWPERGSHRAPPRTVRPWERRVCAGLVAIVLAQVFLNILPSLLLLGYPRLGPDLVLEGGPKPAPLSRLGEQVGQAMLEIPGRSAVAWLNRMTTRAHWLELFSTHHLFGLWTYRMQVRLRSGELLEPVVVFTADQRSGPDNGWIQQKWLHPAMYILSGLANRGLASGFEQVSPIEAQWIERLLAYPLSRLTQAERAETSELRLLVAPVLVPPATHEPPPRVAPAWQVLALRTAGDAIRMPSTGLHAPCPDEIRLGAGGTLRFTRGGAGSCPRPAPDLSRARGDPARRAGAGSAR